MHPRFHAATDPNKAAVIIAESGARLSYATLESRANQGAQMLRKLGLRNGDTIAIWLPNILEYYEVYWAAQRAGLYITPISTALTAAEAGYILSDSGSKLLVTSAHVKAAEALLAARAELAPTLQHILWAGPALADGPSWTTEIAFYPAVPIEDEQAGFHMVYSSGTTGRPKGIRIPLSGGPATDPHILAEKSQVRYGIDRATVYLSPAPLYHTAPLAITTAAQRLGATIVLMEKFEPEACLAAIARFHVTFTQMVPTMFIRMLRLPNERRAAYDVSSLKHIVHAAAPCPVPVKQQMFDWFGPIIYEYYGGSEGNGSTFITPEEWLAKPGSVGKADWGVVHICDAAGNELPRGEQGEVYFEGGWDFRYFNDDEKTRQARNPHHPGWTSMGDIGFLDTDGYLFLTDRKSFMIISGGVNIYPQEAENVLASHPRVQDVAVIGVPDAEMGEAVRAVVQPVDWADANDDFAQELIAYCRARISRIKCPRAVDFLAELPRHETGKLYKRELRKRYWSNA